MQNCTCNRRLLMDTDSALLICRHAEGHRPALRALRVKCRVKKNWEATYGKDFPVSIPKSSKLCSGHLMRLSCCFSHRLRLLRKSMIKRS